MAHTKEYLIKLQTDFCAENDFKLLISTPDSMLGFALETTGLLPINGLRHPTGPATNGWFVWCGEHLSSAADFFKPLHTKHLVDRCPEILKLLGLPPGHRFLLGEQYLDVWFDKSLLAI